MKLIHISLIVVLISIVGCINQSSSEIPASDEKKSNIHSGLMDRDSVLYQMPSPGEIMKRFDTEKFQYKPELLSAPENKSSYITTLSKSLNLGIYISDMAYCANFGMTNEAIAYLETIKILSYEVNISTSVFESLIQRTKILIGQRDSIIAISDEVYNEMINYLGSGGKINTIALISSGALIESMFLVIESADQNINKTEMIKHLEDLRTPLENLLAQTQNSDNDPNFIIIQLILQEIKNMFLKLNSENTQILVTGNEGNAPPEGGMLNEDNFASLKMKVREIRSNIIRN